MMRRLPEWSLLCFQDAKLFSFHSDISSLLCLKLSWRQWTGVINHIILTRIYLVLNLYFSCFCSLTSVWKYPCIASDYCVGVVVCTAIYIFIFVSQKHFLFFPKRRGGEFMTKTSLSPRALKTNLHKQNHCYLSGLRHTEPETAIPTGKNKRFIVLATWLFTPNQW